MTSSPRLFRRFGVALAAALLAVPSLPALGAVIDADGPMVASARAGARRATPPPPAATAPVSTTSPVPSEAASLAAEVVRLTNLERAGAGRSPLSVHPAVSAAAVAHSEDQAAMGRMSHTGSDGSDAGTRLTRAGFEWHAWGENVASGQPSAQAVVDAWMGSSGHRANILNATFTTIGVGVARDADGRPYWTMVLATG